MKESAESKVSEKKAALSGRRFTIHRSVLLDLLQKSEGHLDAEELYRRAKEIEPHISLSTVYRNLQLFKKLDLIEERHFDEEHHHYEAKTITEHIHVVCLDCGKVVELLSPLTKRIKEEVGNRKGFEITNSEIHLEGYCPQCLKKRGKQ